MKHTEIETIIETPKGSRNKLKYEPSHRAFKLSKVMPQGMVFPFDFGFIPKTKGEDGDPLDVLVLTDDPLFPGCVADCRLVGVIEAEQEVDGEMKRNDRLIAVAKASLLYSDVNDMGDLNPTLLKQIEAFFVNYQRVRDVAIRIIGRAGPDKAATLIRRNRRSRSGATRKRKRAVGS